MPVLQARELETASVAGTSAAAAAGGLMRALSASHLYDEVGLQAAVLDVQARRPQVGWDDFITEIGQEAGCERSSEHKTTWVGVMAITEQDTAC